MWRSKGESVSHYSRWRRRQLPVISSAIHAAANILSQCGR